MIKQHRIERYFISAALLLAMIFFSYSASALTPNNLPSKNDIKSSLTALSKKSSLSEEEKLVRGDLEKTSDFYNELDKLEQRTEELQKNLIEPVKNQELPFKVYNKLEMKASNRLRNLLKR